MFAVRVMFCSVSNIDFPQNIKQLFFQKRALKENQLDTAVQSADAAGHQDLSQNCVLTKSPPTPASLAQATNDLISAYINLD